MAFKILTNFTKLGFEGDKGRVVTSPKFPGYDRIVLSFD
jgi:hypothetical protein